MTLEKLLEWEAVQLNPKGEVFFPVGQRIWPGLYQVAQFLSHYEVLTSVSSAADERLMELNLNRTPPIGPRPGTKYLYFVPNQKVSFQSRTIELDGLEEVIIPSEAEKDLAIEGMRTFAVDLIPSLSKAYESVEVKWGIFHYTFD